MFILDKYIVGDNDNVFGYGVPVEIDHSTKQSSKTETGVNN